MDMTILILFLATTAVILVLAMIAVILKVGRPMININNNSPHGRVGNSDVGIAMDVDINVDDGPNLV
jgi:hypothetical protein